MVKNVKSVLFSLIKNILTSARNSFVYSCEDSNLQNKKGLISYKPQFGVEDLFSMRAPLLDIARFAHVNIDDSTMRICEGLCALFVNLSECKTLTHLTSALLLYFRDMIPSSMLHTVMSYVKSVLDDLTFDRQSDLLDPSWLDVLRNVQSNWSLVKENKAFKQFSKLMSVCVTLGLCQASDLTFDILGFKMFDESLFKKHLTAFDLAEAIFGTIAYFTEGMYLCFKTGSIQPLLLNDFSILELDEEYVNILMWWDLVKNGNLQRILGVSDAEFNHRLDNLIIRMSNLMSSLIGFDKKIVSDKVLKLKLMKNDYIAMKISSGTRRAPFAIELFGESSQGKTTFGDQLIDALLVSAGLPTDKQYRAALNPGDKFYSNWTSDKLVAILDDLSNEKSDFVEKAPTRAVIDFCNNQMFYAPKAEIDAKGKCFVEPELVLVTTNKKDLDAYVYSNCPYSVQRRMDLVMTVRCRPEFQRVVEVNGVPVHTGVDSAKVREYYTDENGVYNPPLIDDIWSIDIERAVKPDNLRYVATYEPLMFDGQYMTGLRASAAIQFAIESYKVHRSNQDSIMDAMKSRDKVMRRCDVDGCCHIRGHCPYHFDVQFGMEIALALNDIGTKCYKTVINSQTTILNRFEKYSTQKLYDYADIFTRRWDWLCVVPEDVMMSDKFVDLVYWWNKDKYEIARNKSIRSMLCLLFISIFINAYLFVILFMLCLLVLASFSVSALKKRIIEELARRNDALPIIVRGARDKYAKALCCTFGAISCLYLLSKVYTSWKKIVPAQGALEPKTEDDIRERDSEVNVWSRVVKREVPVSRVSESTTTENMIKSIQKNLFYASVMDGSSRLMANVLFLKTNILIIPNHYFVESDELELVCYKDDADACGGKFQTRVSKLNSLLIPNTDLRICHVSSGGSFKNIVDYFPLDKPKGQQVANMVWRSKVGECVSGRALHSFKTTTNGTCPFYGSVYSNFDRDTFQGMCGAIWVADTSKPYIVGFHLGGIADTPRGCAGALTVKEITNAIAELSSWDGLVVGGSDSEFRPHMLGVRIMTGDPLHRKSPLNYLPIGSQYQYYGSCVGASTSYSCVRSTPISETITNVCGVANVWGPPKFKPEWYGWQKCLSNASIPAKEFEHELLFRAIADYKKPLLKVIKQKYWSVMRPLTTKENINGMPGVRFIDAINMSTSIGYPLTGPKSKYVVDMEAKDEHGMYNRIFKKEVMDLIHEAEQNYRNGCRNHFIAKACKKDEALVVSKEKCRIFYGNSVAFTFLIRKYFLPIVRFVGVNPLLCECAVGVNCHSQEWDQLYKKALKYGDDRIIGGDYGKYDQKLPSQLILATLGILIDCAKHCNYSADDIHIMQTMSADIAYSYIAMNGDMISVTSGTHISGNSLTVLINSIAGSLNMRCVFMRLYGYDLNFRDCVSLVTYGDDNIGSVRKGYDAFNIKSCAEILAEYGQEYTMPDKNSEIVPYLDKTKFEFLKRSSVYHDELGCFIGALDENSIFKSLHCYLRPKKCILTPMEACAMNIDGALREWFNHGESIYETRRAQMQKIASIHNLEQQCVMLHRTYDECVALWKNGNLNESVPDDTGDEGFMCQSGFETEDLYIKAQADIQMSVLSVNQVIIHQDFGEVDIIFKRVFDNVEHYLIVEIKHSYCQSIRRKGRQQLRRVCSALSMLRVGTPILAVLLTPYGYELVDEFGGVGMWHRFNLPFATIRPT